MYYNFFCHTCYLKKQIKKHKSINRAVKMYMYLGNDSIFRKCNTDCRAFIGKKILIKLFVMINSMMLMYNSAWML